MFSLNAQKSDELMQRALEEAIRSLETDDVPVGAIILDENGKIIAQGRNTRERDEDPLGHAEIMAIAQASDNLGTWRLENCTLVVTLEPCVMCAGAILSARIARVIFGAWDEKAGAVGSVYDVLRDRLLHHPEVEVIAGVRSHECGELLTNFFRHHLD